MTNNELKLKKKQQQKNIF